MARDPATAGLQRHLGAEGATISEYKLVIMPWQKNTKKYLLPISV